MIFSLIKPKYLYTVIFLLFCSNYSVFINFSSSVLPVLYSSYYSLLMNCLMDCLGCLVCLHWSECDKASNILNFSYLLLSIFIKCGIKCCLMFLLRSLVFDRPHLSCPLFYILSVCFLFRTKSNQRWMKLRTTVQISSAIQKVS